MGADAEATRRSILDAAREVISERGLHAATFQQIAVRAGVSRPTLHYYFSTREQVYEILLRDAYAQVAKCAIAAQRETGLRAQLTVFLMAMQKLNFSDSATTRFMVTARLEHHRGQQHHKTADAVIATVHGFYLSIVVQAIARGELAPDTAPREVADMLAALFWGIGFHAGFVDGNDSAAIARQLLQVFGGGLLNERVGIPVEV